MHKIIIFVKFQCAMKEDELLFQCAMKEDETAFAALRRMGNMYMP